VKDKVRLIEQKKTRYILTPYYYAIRDISDKSILISVTDGSVKTVTRPQFITNNISTKLKETRVMEDNPVADSVIEIIMYYPQMDFYQVKFDALDENYSYIDTIKTKELRINE
jgi:hypothetical protein